ncbi:ead/Ea22-like family protein [Salmonella enterica]|nr:ead/Ea22-like family protein [Salmonella enterica]ECG1136364.1 ead/Ea22-like family protein [Salmonella enterica subsp. enterica]EBE4568644.1 ead/Ea22-like family protein [Salmonella enterica]EBR1859930.1 ead/Ea22-like family protein [Salmonella enterica]ECE3295048.1 ead/Ea22-like family protein [Salmonella enterica]
MSNIDKRALLVSKAKASVFTMGYISQFEASDIDSDDIDLRFEVDGTETGTIVSIVDECGHAAQIITALLDELEAARQRIAELENSETQLINERDAAESALADMYQAATGERPEWSNMFGFADAVDVVEERLATLEANQSQTTPTGIQLITEAIGAHGYIVGCLLQGRPDLALEESRKWVSAFGQAAEIVSAQDAAGIKVKGE